MKGFVVTLREDGLFEAPATQPGRSAIRITYDAYVPAAPWVAMALDDMGIKWTLLDTFHCLDAAIDYAVRVSLGENMVPEYGVVLPDGSSFRRPGRIAIEQVMASAGWLFVTNFIGFTMVRTEPEATMFDARAIMQERIGATTAVLGEVNVADRDEDGLHWCADIELPCEGFVQIENINREAKAAFDEQGIDIIPHFDFRSRTSVSLNHASVISFPEDRIVRRMTAA